MCYVLNRLVSQEYDIVFLGSNVGIISEICACCHIPVMEGSQLFAYREERNNTPP